MQATCIVLVAQSWLAMDVREDHSGGRRATYAVTCANEKAEGLPFRQVHKLRGTGSGKRGERRGAGNEWFLVPDVGRERYLLIYRDNSA